MKLDFGYLCKTALLIGAACIVANCETTAPPPTPPPPPPPQPVVQAPQVYVPPPLNIALRTPQERENDAIIRAAGNHAVVMSRIRALQTEPIRSAEHLNQILADLSQVYSPGIGPSMLGYGAMIGAQDTDFVHSVREMARYSGKDTVVYQLYSNRDYPLQFSASVGAAAKIRRAWQNDIAAIDSAAAAVKQQSYDLQKQAGWKKLKADSRPERLKVISSAKSRRFDPPVFMRRTLAGIGTFLPSGFDHEQRRSAFFSAFGRSAPHAPMNAGSGTYMAEMEKVALTLAALEILGSSGPASSVWIENYMTSPATARCVNTARLNAEQCVAAGYFKYEDAFCVAEHELTEISSCMREAIR